MMWGRDKGKPGESRRRKATRLSREIAPRRSGRRMYLSYGELVMPSDLIGLARIASAVRGSGSPVVVVVCVAIGGFVTLGNTFIREKNATMRVAIVESQTTQRIGIEWGALRPLGDDAFVLWRKIFAPGDSLLVPFTRVPDASSGAVKNSTRS